VLISFGRDAERSVLGLDDQLDARGITHLRCIHPSMRRFNSRREQTVHEVSTAFQTARSIVEADENRPD
jgi:hypothetical protein